jgi:hypothetical protein
MIHAYLKTHRYVLGSRYPGSWGDPCTVGWLHTLSERNWEGLIPHMEQAQRWPHTSEPCEGSRAIRIPLLQ